VKQFLLHNIFILALIVISQEMIAQINKSVQIDWRIAAILPASPGNYKPLGQAGPLAGIHINVMIIAGGANFPDKAPWLGGKKRYYNDVFVFRKDVKGAVSQLAASFQLPYNTAYGANCSTPQGIVYAGGENEEGISNKVILVQWNTATKSVVIKYLPSLPFPVTNAAAVCNDNVVYIAGGETPDGGVSSKFHSLDLNNISSGWKQLADLPKPLSHSVMAVQWNGVQYCVYVVGGRKRNSSGISDLYNTVYSYDLKNAQWQEKKSLPYSLSAGTGVATGAKSILLFGGDKGETFHKAETLIAAINEEKDPAKREELNRQKIEVQAMHPGFSKEVLLYNTVTDEWSVRGHIPFDVPATTTAFKWGDCVMIPSGEIKAGVRTPRILAGKLKVRYR
jgi:N-acetylneuraminate epimerase